MVDVIGILTFALHAAHKIYDVVQIIKDAPDAVRTLGKDVSRVEGLLTLMLAGPNGQSSSLLHNIGNPLIETLVKDAKELGSATETLLAKVTRQREDGTHKVKKCRWAFHAGEAEKLSGQFQTFYVSLTAVYSVITSCVSAKLM